MYTTTHTNLRKRLVFLCFGILAIGILMFTFSIINSSRTETANVMVTNQTDSSASLVWTTDKPVIGRVIINDQDNLGEGLVLGRKGKEYRDDRDIEELERGSFTLKPEGEQKRYTHHVTIRGLSPESVYFFRVKNGVLATETEVTSFKTTATLEAVETPDPIYGRVFEEGNSVIEDGVVVARKVSGNNDTSQYKSSFLTDSTYTIDIANVFTSDSNEPFINSDFGESIDYLAAINGEVKTFNHMVGQDQDQPVDKVIFKSIPQIGQSSLLNEVYAAGIWSIECNGITQDADEGAKNAFRGEALRVNPALEGKTAELEAAASLSWRNEAEGNCPEIENTDQSIAFCEGKSSGSYCLNDNIVVCPWGSIRFCENQGLTCDLGNNPTKCIIPLGYPKWEKDCGGGVTDEANRNDQQAFLDQHNYISDAEREWRSQACKSSASNPNSKGPGVNSPLNPNATAIPDELEQEDNEVNNVNFESCNNLILRNYECGGDFSSSENTTPCKTSYGETLICRLTVNSTNVPTGGVISVSQASTNQDPCAYGIYTATTLPLECLELDTCPENRVCSDVGSLINSNPSSCLSSNGVQVFSCCPEGLRIVNGTTCALDPNQPVSTDPKLLGGMEDLTPSTCKELGFPINEANRDKVFYWGLTKSNGARTPYKNLDDYKGGVPLNFADYCGRPDNGLNLNSFNKFFSPVNAQSGDLGSEDFDLNNLDAGVYELEGDRVLTKTIEVKESGPLRYYYDTNSNGVKDLGEEYLGEEESKEIQVTLKKTSEIENYTLTNGWNLVHIPMVSDSIKKASDLINSFNDEGANVTHITTYRNGKFVVFSQRVDDAGQIVTFGNDFNVLPGEGYFVRNYTDNIRVSLSGNKVEGSLELLVEPGWNLVGFYNEGKSYQGFEILRQMNQSNIEADILSSWTNGMYTNLVLEDGVEYGADYRVFPNSGYWVRSNSTQPTNFSPN